MVKIQTKSGPPSPPEHVRLDIFHDADLQLLLTALKQYAKQQQVPGLPDTRAAYDLLQHLPDKMCR